MSLAVELMQDITSGVPAETIIARPQYAWNRLSPAEREAMLQAAATHGPQHPTLCSIIGRLAWKAQDWWSVLRAQIVLAPLPNLSPEQRQLVFQSIETTLAKLGQSLTIQEAQRYRRYQADITMLRAKLLFEQSRLVDARQQYELAADYYRQCSYAPGVEQANQHRDQVLTLLERQQALLPLDQLQSQHLKLIEQVDQVAAQVAAAEQVKRALDVANENTRQAIEQARSALEGLQAQSQALDARMQEQHAALQARSTEVAQVGQWLAAISETATAPVWAAAARAALWQGEIDEVTVSALKRLAQTFPDNTLPLLVEIAARAPEAFQADGHMQLADFQANLLQAKACQDDDPMTAAECLVAAWERALQLQGQAVDAG